MVEPVEIKAGKKYKVLEYPNFSTNLMTVKVKKVYSTPAKGVIVEYVYNWPFPITAYEKLRIFTSWVATEVK